MPERTIHLLAELKTLGFTNADFQVLCPRGTRGTIDGHIDHCTNLERLDCPGSNYLLKYRLEIVLALFRGRYGRRKAQPNEFQNLAQEAVQLTPPPNAGGP
jgi:hypothetical protein